MTLISKRVGLVAAVAVAIAVGSALVYLQQNPRTVGVTVVNGSGKQIHEVRVEYERGVALTGNLDKGQEKIVRLPPEGDTSFKIRVQFVDGSELVSEGRYAEPGYEFHATIRESVIAIEMRLPPY